AVIGLGGRPVGARASASVRLRNTERGFAWGAITLQPPLPGISAPARFESHNALIEIRLDARTVPPGAYRGSLLLQAEGVPTPCQIPLQFRVVPLIVEVEPPALVSGTLRHGERFVASLRLTAQPAGGRLTGSAAFDPPL